MNESEMLTAIRNRYQDAYAITGEKHKELIICHKRARTRAEFAPDDEVRMRELVRIYGGDA